MSTGHSMANVSAQEVSNLLTHHLQDITQEANHYFVSPSPVRLTA